MPDEGIERPHVARSGEVAAVGGYIDRNRSVLRTATIPLAGKSEERNRYGRFLKRGIDIVGAAVGVVLFLPVMAFVAVAIAWSDGFPVLFTQERVGRDFRPFKMLKFRTMKRNAEAMLQEWKADDHPLWRGYVSNNFKLPHDPRTMPFGTFLRRYSLDELPQLWNVLRGDMSLVGPRPLLRRELPEYACDVNVFGCVRPGITGLWQISGRSSTNFSDRARLDRDYVVNLSFLGDCRILLRTVPICLTGLGAY